METFRPRALSSRPIAAAVTPLPTELTTPPVMKMYFVMMAPPCKLMTLYYQAGLPPSYPWLSGACRRRDATGRGLFRPGPLAHPQKSAHPTPARRLESPRTDTGRAAARHRPAPLARR